MGQDILSFLPKSLAEKFFKENPAPPDYLMIAPFKNYALRLQYQQCYGYNGTERRGNSSHVAV